MDIVERIKDEVKITEIFSEVTRVDNSGFCKCPFHQETTPSCKLDKHKNMYYCFGCGSGGDVFTFIQALHNISFAEAKKMLAERIGVKLEDETTSEEKKLVIAICNESCQFFIDKLKTHSIALEYLSNRKIDEALITRFRLGYAPEDQYLLRKHLKSCGFDDNAIAQSGLFLGTRCRFKNRIMFPIIDYSGNCIGFGGRILSAVTEATENFVNNQYVEPKYINSAQTVVFSKKRSLYGSFDKKLFNGKNKVYIVEGYFDVIKMEQQGFSVAVAPLGTALSQEQIKHCWKISHKPVILMDGDAAGKKAVLRAMEIVAPIITLEQQVAFAYLQDGHDPDSFLSLPEGKEKLQVVLDQSMELQEAIWNHAERIIKSDEGNIVTRIAIASRFIRRLIMMLTDQDLKFAYQSYFRQKLSNISRINNEIPSNTQSIVETTAIKNNVSLKQIPVNAIECKTSTEHKTFENKTSIENKISTNKTFDTTTSENKTSWNRRLVNTDTKDQATIKSTNHENPTPSKIEVIILNRLLLYIKLMILSIVKNNDVSSLKRIEMLSELVESSNILRSWSGFRDLSEVVELISSTKSMDMLPFTINEIKAKYMNFFNDYTILAHPIMRKTGASLTDSFSEIFSSAKIICESLTKRSDKLNF